jgi:hypothetical protein
MNVTTAGEFLCLYQTLFLHQTIREMTWTPSDDDFGRLIEWTLDRNDLALCVATVDLQRSGCTMTVTERDLSDDAEQQGHGTQVVATTIISFDELTLQVNSEDREYTDGAIREAIHAFNELAL